MPPSLSSLFSLALGLSSLSAVSGQQCKLQFDGRVPTTFSAATFDTKNGVWANSFVFGKNLNLSKVVELPKTAGSLFDVNNTQVVGVTINDQSIFAPSATNVQNGFRRAELIHETNSGTDASTTGVKTVHWTMAKDATKALNLSHEYQMVFLEDNKFTTNQIALKFGSLIGVNTPQPDTLQLFGNVNEQPNQLLFKTAFTANTFHNFAVTMDFNKNTTQVFYSTGTTPLKSVTQPLSNPIGGQGQYHFGCLKKGIGGGNDITKNAFQPSGINEAVIYGGIFVEDSADGCVSLSPTTKA